MPLITRTYFNHHRKILIIGTEASKMDYDPETDIPRGISYRSGNDFDC